MTVPYLDTGDVIDDAWVDAVADTANAAQADIAAAEFANFTSRGLLQPGALASTQSMAVRRQVGDWYHEIVRRNITAAGSGATPLYYDAELHTESIGMFWYFDVGSTVYTGAVRRVSGTTIGFQVSGNGSYLGAAPNMAAANGDVLMFERWWRN